MEKLENELCGIINTGKLQGGNVQFFLYHNLHKKLDLMKKRICNRNSEGFIEFFKNKLMFLIL